MLLKSIKDKCKPPSVNSDDTLLKVNTIPSSHLQTFHLHSRSSEICIHYPLMTMDISRFPKSF